MTKMPAEAKGYYNKDGSSRMILLYICDECGEADHVDDEGVSKAVRALATAREFKAERPVLEIRGLCKMCA